MFFSSEGLILSPSKKVMFSVVAADFQAPLWKKLITFKLASIPDLKTWVFSMANKMADK